MTAITEPLTHISSAMEGVRALLDQHPATTTAGQALHIAHSLLGSAHSLVFLGDEIARAADGAAEMARQAAAALAETVQEVSR